VGIEIKRADAPSLTQSMRIAMENLESDKLAVIYPGAVRYTLAPNVQAIPFSGISGKSRPPTTRGVGLMRTPGFPDSREIGWGTV
jgi:hypothetical protein